ncbi:MAG: hypothetical protein PHT84_06005 [Candidatus Pacebacteria bacterium]|nr:hypothetical protein [Candidatus Paceibacterota bacterium]
MSKKNVILLVSFIIILSVLAFFLFGNNKKTDQIVYEDTLTISKEYLVLRYKTDNVLVNAKEYESYDDWNEEVASIIQEWKTLESKALKLEGNANEMSEETTAFNFVQKAYAYTYAEVQAIVEKAPIGRQIRTLAQHLGVDAKRAQLILNQSQDMATREAWGEAGDVFEKLENQAIAVKDTCKVTVYVGGIVATGGAAGFATMGTVTQVTTVVVGVDLALEVTEDSAQIALGDRNKVSSFVKDVRTVTEPIASVLTITDIPDNLGSAYGKFDAVMVGLEQFRDTVQEGKVIGIDLKNFEYHPSFQVIKNTQYPGDINVAEMEMAEVEEWIKSINKDYKPMTKEEVQEFLASTNKETEPTEAVTKKEVTKNEKENNVEQTDEKKDEISESPSNEIKLMPVEEFEELFGDFKIENISEVKEIFGEPDVINTLDDGYGNYIYHRRLVYPNGNIAGMMIRFQNLDVVGYSIMMEEYQ